MDQLNVDEAKPGAPHVSVSLEEISKSEQSIGMVRAGFERLCEDIQNMISDLSVSGGCVNSLLLASNFLLTVRRDYEDFIEAVDGGEFNSPQPDNAPVLGRRVKEMLEHL